MVYKMEFFSFVLKLLSVRNCLWKDMSQNYILQVWDLKTMNIKHNININMIRVSVRTLEKR